ncbi:MAG: hypothetical protein KC503_47460, partial [Myxococcales bacterium]|nr:hypothetical protein [Myxococcales bacterium]
MGLRRALACAALCALLGACATSGPATTGGVEMPPRAKSRRALARKLRPVALRGRWVQTNDGETLDDVAKRTGAPILDLEELNGLPRDRALAANSRVFVPRAAPLPPRQRRAARRASSSSAPARASSRSRSRSRSRASAPTPTPPSPSTPAPRPLGKGAPASGGMLWPVAGGT